MTPETIANIQECLSDTATEWGSSRWGLYAKCPRAHHLRYELGVTKRGHRELHFDVGGLCHSVLQYVQLGVMRREERAWGDVLEYASQQEGMNLAAVDEAARLMKWYWVRWGLENAGWHEQATIVGVEQLLEAPEGSPVAPYTARYDTLLEIGGELVLPDTKTRAMKVPGYSSDGSSIEDEYALAAWKRGQAVNPQFLGLAWLLQQKLELADPPAVMVNAIVKTKVPSFVRVMVRATQAAVDQWAENQAKVQSMHRVPEMNVADQFVTAERMYTNEMRYQSCVPYIGAPCSYFDWCHAPSQESRELHYDVPAGALVR